MGLDAVRKFIDDESSSGKLPSKEGVKKTLQAAALGTGLLVAQTDEPLAAPPHRTIEQQNLDATFEQIAKSPMQSFGPEFFTPEEVKCLEDNVYYEARGEPLPGHYAIMFETLGRLLDKRYPKTICGVVYQNHAHSWTEDKGLLAQPINPQEYLQIALEVYALTRGRDVNAAAVEAGLRSGLPHGAIFFKRHGFVGSKPVQKFFSSLKLAMTIGHHDFFVEKAAPKKAPHKQKKIAKTES